jgi:hypothetical protein
MKIGMADTAKQDFDGNIVSSQRTPCNVGGSEGRLWRECAIGFDRHIRVSSDSLAKRKLILNSGPAIDDASHLKVELEQALETHLIKVE